MDQSKVVDRCPSAGAWVRGWAVREGGDVSEATLWARKIWAAIIRLVAPPSYGSCLCCGISWWLKGWHSTNFSDSEGCFPLCEFCWSRMTPDQRLPFYEYLINEWQQQEIRFN